MTRTELLAALNRLKIETGSLACLGCGHEHDCSTQGCAIIREEVRALGAAGDFRPGQTVFVLERDENGDVYAYAGNQFLEQIGNVAIVKAFTFNDHALGATLSRLVADTMTSGGTEVKAIPIHDVFTTREGAADAVEQYEPSLDLVQAWRALEEAGHDPQ